MRASLKYVHSGAYPKTYTLTHDVQRVLYHCSHSEAPSAASRKPDGAGLSLGLLEICGWF